MKDEFLIISAWGCGFYSDFLHVVQGIALAKALEVRPIIDWNSNSLYYNGQNVYSQIFKTSQLDLGDIGFDLYCVLEKDRQNVFDIERAVSAKKSGLSELEYVKQISQDVARDGLGYYSRYCFTLNSIINKEFNLNVNLSDVFKKLHVPREIIHQELDQFLEYCNIGKDPLKFNCAHIRGSEKTRTKAGSAHVASIYAQKSLSYFDKDIPIILITEDPVIFDTYYEHMKKCGYEVFSPKTNRSLTYGNNLLGFKGMEQSSPHLNTNRLPEERLGLAIDVVRDVLLAQNSITFLGSKSNVSSAILTLRDNRESEILNIPDVLTEVDLYKLR